MNPGLILQGVSAATGLIGSVIPDKVVHETELINTQGNKNAGMVSGAVGAETTKEVTSHLEQPGIKKALLGVSKVSGAVGSLISPFTAGTTIPKTGIKADIQTLLSGIKNTTSTLVPQIQPLKEEPLVDDIPQNILDLAKTTVPQSIWKYEPTRSYKGAY